MNSNRLLPNLRTLRFLAKRLSIFLIPALLVLGITAARAECAYVDDRVICT